MSFNLKEYLAELETAIIVEGFDKDDRFYHAADKTWWKWDGKSWKASEPPNGWRLLPNEKADLPPTKARGPRSGTEGAIGG